LAEEEGANVIFVECCCPYSVLRKRLAKRRGRKLPTDARLRHLEALRQAFEPLTELEADTHLQVETGPPLEQNLQYIFSAAYKLLRQQAHDTQALNCFKIVEELE
jgi:predicted kinase